MLNVKPSRCQHKRSTYNGRFDGYGRRSGLGEEKWREMGQEYEGTFVRDAFHGEGTYKWLTEKSRLVYEGQFYSNRKEGYGLVSLPDGSTFEGLFYNDRAFGPGVRTHLDGRQDVGFWCGERLVRLSRPVDFIVPRLASTLAGKLKLLQFQALLPYSEEKTDVAKAVLLKFGFDVAQATLLYSNLIHDQRSLFFNKIGFDQEYFRNERGEDSKEAASSDVDLFRYFSTPDPTGAANSRSEMLGEAEEPEDVTFLVSWNRSELCMEILKQIFRFHSFEDRLTFKISDLMAGVRTNFRKTGDVERLCLYFLKACSTGPSHVVRELLCSRLLSESLMDSRGNSCVMLAAAADQHEIIEILLDYGADVNAFNDENLTPLNLCLLRRLARTESLGNWEASFVAPESGLFDVVGGRNRIWKDRESIRSLDRILDQEPLEEAARPGEKLHPTDSHFCFHGEAANEDESDIALMDDMECTRKPFSARAVPGVTDTGEMKFDFGKAFVLDSYKREEYVKSVAQPTEKDRYFFDLTPECSPARIAPHLRGSADSEGGRREESSKSIDKVALIDKTIQLLLIRGADPNLGDAPKPSLHLAVYSKDLDLVRLLLAYGAAPDSQTQSQEGLLTPLHVVVLMKPSREQVKMCELLLNHGASPEEETSPSFNPGREDESLLDPDRGRTPLQLLCTRKDAEFAERKEFLSCLALLLASVSKRRNFFRGHSYLTLAMMYGNYSLMNSLLKSPKVDPNEVLGNDLGTAFHVLVSTSFQKRTSYEDSIRMCDMLLQSGGNPEMSFERPSRLAGTCVDFGYREIQEERNRREAGQERRRSVDKDHLEDHVRVIDYLAGKLTTRGGKRPAGKEGSGKLRSRRADAGEGQKMHETRKEREKKERPEDSSKIIEIKKHVASAKEKGGRKRADRQQEIRAESAKQARALPRKMKESNMSRRTTGDSRVASLGWRSRSVRRARFSERLPERFRQSLLHMFGYFGSGSFDLNDLLLPYVVLRNGDLYYRFKGRKPLVTEQYSLI